MLSIRKIKCGRTSSSTPTSCSTIRARSSTSRTTTVVIPIYVLEEIDQFKKELSRAGSQRARGRAPPRRVPRQRASSLSEGVPLRARRPAAGGARHAPQLPDALRVVAVAGQQHPRRGARGARSRARMCRRSSSPRTSTCASAPTRSASTPRSTTPRQIDIEELYSGNGEVEVPASAGRSVLRRGRAAGRVAGATMHQDLRQPVLAAARSREPAAHRARPLRRAEQEASSPIKKLREGVWGIRPRNKEQHFALDLLLNDDIKLVTLVGKAGTGKTLLAIAAGLQKFVEERHLPEAARLAPDLPARPGHRLSARRHRGEAQPVDAADLRQRRVAAGLLEGREEGGPLATRS